MKGLSNRKRAMIALGVAAALLGSAALMLYWGAFQFNYPPEQAYPVRGVDVSHYQGEIDWPTLASQGIRFAWIKATEGSGHTDERFAENWRSASETSLRVGAYHFFSFDSPGAIQAEHFLSTLADSPGTLPPAVDVEPYGAHRSKRDMDFEEIAAELRAFLNAVETGCGMRPVLYTTQALYDAFLADSFPDCDFWLRGVYGAPPAGARWTFWQYSDRARLRGYSGEEKFIDMNAFCGSEAAFEGYGR